ncbi:MAG: LysE family translocator [Oceanococcaceae bacterium]
MLEAIALMAVMVPLAAMPSSSVALVVVRSASAGRWHGISAAAGIVAGDLVFVAMALLGMAVLAQQWAAVFAMVKFAGAAYLFWLGLPLMRAPSVTSIASTSTGRSTLLADFLAGLMLTLGDVKAVVYYASLFPAVVDLTRVGAADVAGIVIITMVAVGGVKGIYVFFAARIVERLRGRITATWPGKVGGVLLMGCGVTLVASTVLSAG